MMPRLPLHLLMQRLKLIDWPNRQQQTMLKLRLSWPKRLRLLQHSEHTRQLRQCSTQTPQQVDPTHYQQKE